MARQPRMEPGNPQVDPCPGPRERVDGQPVVIAIELTEPFVDVGQADPHPGTVSALVPAPTHTATAATATATATSVAGNPAGVGARARAGTGTGTGAHTRADTGAETGHRAVSGGLPGTARQHRAQPVGGHPDPVVLDADP